MAGQSLARGWLRASPSSVLPGLGLRRARGHSGVGKCHCGTIRACAGEWGSVLLSRDIRGSRCCWKVLGNSQSDLCLWATASQVIQLRTFILVLPSRSPLFFVHLEFPSLDRIFLRKKETFMFKCSATK